jgi:hypothetical protein
MKTIGQILKMVKEEVSPIVSELIDYINLAKENMTYC